MNDVSFVLGQGGLGRPLPGEDYYSGMIFYTADNTLPSGFSTTKRIRQFASPAQAAAAGIRNDYNDATAATSTSTVTAVGANGSKVTVTIAEPNRVLNFGTYTKAASEATADAVAGKLAALINLGVATYSDADGRLYSTSHQYTATADGTPSGELIITAPKSQGAYLNTKSPVFTEDPTNSTFAVTIGAFTGGVTSKQAVWNYHISEFFRRAPKGQLFVGFFAVPGTYDFAEVGTVQAFALGKIRQIGVYKDAAAFATADITALHNACAAQVVLHKELMAVYTADISGVTDLTTLADLKTLSAQYVMATIGQDGGAQGAFLAATYGKTVGTLGATLGALALAKVSESIAWVEKFNMSNGTELDTPAIGNGALIKNTDENLLTDIQGKGYNFLRQFVGTAGSYFCESRTSVSSDSDYAYAENVRTIQKATRGVYKSLVPALNAPIVLNTDGTLTDISIEYFRVLADKNLTDMVSNRELSSFKTDIDASQNVLTTGILVVSVDLLPIGVARNIQVNIGFTVSIQ